MFGGGHSFNPDTDIPDLSGKVVLVTGGNNGLGAESVLQLAKRNAHVYLAARTPSKAESAIATIKKEVPDANITFLQLDLASLESVKKAADTFYASSPRLDILMNNAGVMAIAPGTTQEGYEIQFGTNHVGHACLTSKLLPTLLKTAEEPNSDVRIINLTSVGHKFAPKGGLALADARGPMTDYSTWTRYGHSKLANILFTQDLAQRYPRIKSIAVHPGAVETGLSGEFLKSHPWLAVLYKLLIRPLTSTSVQNGARGQLWCATSREAKSGAYYVPVAKEDAGSEYVRDKRLREELAKWTEAELAKHGC